MSNDHWGLDHRLEKVQALAKIGNWELDLISQTLRASTEAFRIYGLEKRHDLPWAELQKVIHPEDRSRLDRALRLLIEQNAAYNLEFRIRRLADGSERVVHSVAELEFDRDGLARKVVGFVHDVTERKRDKKVIADYIERLMASERVINNHLREMEIQKETLRRSEDRYRVLVENSCDGIFSCDLHGRLITANRRFCQITGYNDGEIIGRTLAELAQNDPFIWSWQHNFEKMLKKEKIQMAESSQSNSFGISRFYSITLVPLYNNDQMIIGALGTCHDITEIRKHDQMVSRFAYDDHLTGLPNRRFFEQSLSWAIHHAEKRGTKIAVLFMDCDNFQRINDTLGHRVGDDVIRIVAERLKGLLQKNEVVARFGGDEFSFFIPDVHDRQRIEELVGGIQEAVGQDIQAGVNCISIKSSMGIAFYPDDGLDAEELMKSADSAMYKAKELGKNNCQIYDKKMKNDLLRRINIEKHLMAALANDELFLHYQPQMDMNGKIRGCEALLRWQSQGMGGRISPYELIPVAEETSLIRPIGDWVLETACRQTREWQDKYDFQGVISVNISPVQLYQNNFAATVKGILESTGLSPEFLELEITEGVLISSLESVIRDIEELRSFGVKISLDDFGTGYSSLNYLRKLPVDTLKIDKSFIEHIDDGSKEKAIMQFVLSLIHELNLEVIAEGVETAEQLAYLKQNNCDFIQGFLMHRPLRREEFSRLLAKGGKS